MKKLLALILALLFVVSSTACFAESEDDWAYIADKGTLIIGITEYQPMNYYVDGELTGFDTEFAEAVCEYLGIIPEFVVIDWSMKETELSAKKIDCIWNGFTVTDERRENMDFSASYMLNQQVIVTKAENADKYTDLASLAGANLVAEEGSSGEAVITADAGLAENYTPVASLTTALTNVLAGTADAAVVDYVMANYTIASDGSNFAGLQILNQIDLEADEEYAIGFRKGSTAVEKVDEALSYLYSDGTFAEIAAKYGLEDLLIG